MIYKRGYSVIQYCYPMRTRIKKSVSKHEGDSYGFDQILLQELQVYLGVRPEMRGISHPDRIRHLDGVRHVDVPPDELVLA